MRMYKQNVQREKAGLHKKRVTGIIIEESNFHKVKISLHNIRTGKEKKKEEQQLMASKVTAWHTASAGIVIYIEEKDGVGFDVFARDPGKLYPDTPEPVRQQLLSQIETGRIGTLVFTHEHGDHFHLEDVLETLRRNPGLRIISTEKVIRQIRAREPEAGRLTAVAASEEKYRMINLPQMQLTLFNSVHMGEQYADVQNLVCLLEVDGKRILIPGDARPERQLYGRAAAWSKEIDWLIGPFPLLGLPSSRRQICACLKLDHVLAVHLPRPEKDREGWRNNAGQLCETAADGLPVPVFGDELGKRYEL